MAVWVFTINASAQSISTSIDKRDILIGEHIQYNVRLNLPGQGYKVDFQIPDSIAHLEVMQKKQTDSVDKKGAFSEIKMYITSWDSGKWYLPPIPLRIQMANKPTPYFIKTDPIEINVGLMPIDSTGKPRDIKGPIQVPAIAFNWLWLLPIALLSLLLFLLLRKWLKRKPNQTPLFDAKTTAYKEAIDALHALDPKQFDQAEGIKIYHSTLTDIFKRYVSRTFNKNFLVFTTAEVMSSLPKQKPDSALYREIKDVLQRADAVKFAKSMPALEESIRSKNELIKVISDLEQNKLNI